MKTMYEELDMEVIRFNAEDVITASGDEEEICDDPTAVSVRYVPDNEP